MANFETHWRVGLGAAICSAVAFNLLDIISPRQVPILIGAGVIASIVPDIDSDTSRPLRIIFGGLAILLPPILIWRIPWLYASLLRVLVFWALSFYMIYSPIKWLFKRKTRHRGIIHSIPAAIIYGGIAFSLVHYEAHDRRLQFAVGLSSIIGFLVHLTLDEIWAVDFNGVTFKKKRSFGTALCWSGKTRWLTFKLYFTLALISWTCWRQWVGHPVIPPQLQEWMDTLL
jgi:hypothetical protein